MNEYRKTFIDTTNKSMGKSSETIVVEIYCGKHRDEMGNK